MKTVVLIISIILSQLGIINAQFADISCNNRDTVKAYKREKDIYKKSDAAFNIALCYKQKNDTTANKWFDSVIQNYRDNLKRDCSPYSVVRPIVYYHIGMSYLYLEGVSSDRAYVWLAKAYIQYKNDDEVFKNLNNYSSQLLYNYGKVCIYQEQFSEAINSLSKFQEVADSKLDSEILIENARNKKR